MRLTKMHFYQKLKNSFYKFLQCAIINLKFKKKLIVCFKKEKGYESVNDYKGKLNAAEPENADKLMRTQFLKYFSEVH